MTYNDENILIGAVILAAGHSSRMNFPKPFLVFDKSKIFIEKIIDEYINLKCDNIAVITNSNHNWESIKKHYEDKQIIKFIENNHQEYERFYSVKLGLTALTNIDFCFIQNIDNPFVDLNLLNTLLKSKSENDYCVPVYQNKGGHPILINKIISKKLVEQENNSNLKEVLNSFDRINVPFDKDKILVNINTQDDYNNFKLKKNN